MRHIVMRVQQSIILYVYQVSYSAQEYTYEEKKVIKDEGY